MTKQYEFLIAPDFPPSQAFDWYRVNILLQNALQDYVHLRLTNSFEDFHQHMLEEPSIVYVGAYDTAQMIREYNYLPLARPESASDEVVIFSSSDTNITHLKQLSKSTEFICLTDMDVERIGRILLEPADIVKKEVAWQSVDSYQAVLRLLSEDKNRVGIMRLNNFKQLSPMVRKRFQPVIYSSLSVLYHTLLLSPKLANHHQEFVNAFTSLKQHPALHNLGIRGFKPMNDTVANFICDIVDTLV